MLELQGVSIWIDKKINIGQSWRKEIQQQLDSAEQVIVLWSPSSIKSDFVLAEAERAKA